MPLRLKSASMPWPMASWSRMPDEPAASTTGISPAGGGHGLEQDDGAVHRLACTTRSSARRCRSRGRCGRPRCSRSARAGRPARPRRRGRGWSWAARPRRCGPLLSAIRIALASSAKLMLTFLTRGSAAKARSLSRVQDAAASAPAARPPSAASPGSARAGRPRRGSAAGPRGPGRRRWRPRCAPRACSASRVRSSVKP